MCVHKPLSLIKPPSLFQDSLSSIFNPPAPIYIPIFFSAPPSHHLIGEKKSYMKHVIATNLMSFLPYAPPLPSIQREDCHARWPCRELEEEDKEEERSAAFVPRV